MSFSLKDYEIIDEIARGGFGTIFRARQESLGRTVAIKCLSPQRLQNKNDIMRLHREAKAMAALSHDNILSVYDYTYHAGNYYMVMEYIEGITLEDALQQNISQAALLYVLERAFSALACAHDAHIIHRDLKPSNVLLGKNGQIKLADFGLATFRQAVGHPSSSNAVGTLWYMAPEALVSPKEIDHRADIFSCGCILYQVLSGHLPFPGESVGDVSYKILNEAPVHFESVKESVGLGEITLQCLHKDREQRPTLSGVLDQLREVLRTHGHTAHDDLIGFVRTKGGHAQVGPSPLLVNKVHQALGPGPTKNRRIIAGALSAAAALGLAVLLLWVLRDRKQAIDLPVLPSLGPSVADDSPLPLPRAEEGANTKGPEPLIGSRLGHKAGTIVITGMGTADTVRLDGKVVQEKDQSGKIRIPISPGHHTIKVTRVNGQQMERDVEIMPYQIWEWNIKHEGISHGRKE